MDTTKAKQKRRNYPIKEKLAIVAEHEAGVTGSGFCALGSRA
ncbi:hypothetical protein PC129_g10719 [Phytophthora cactorum]|uniref:Transposase n=1 Tax=Phytophthora cactorum TaxID=29920 RepID=A0A8T1FSH3_9STRA|nr:hypothetical protein Pcac1_g11625 [Phytophthora cactorum]KAG2816283.1 hypothetical protein PC112_g13526 [Phytophthora cactorum]KAG2818287.1 hypothetical protein PC111_g12367 [Phytophthora cactorum]KAG2855023.1 hypothetical protein PC113_g12801 [Phytophthora cactorum]KAG2897592.1 hypothetical protein PC114_g14612 [Phytophthora cactorum]